MKQTKKVNISKIIEKIKGNKDFKKAPISIPVRNHRERDMRQDAIESGSHEAKEMWGEPNGAI